MPEEYGKLVSIVGVGAGAIADIYPTSLAS